MENSNLLEDKKYTVIYLLGAFCIGTLAVLSQYVTPYMLLATLAYFLLVIGLQFRKINRKVHATLMTTGIIFDLSLVLILEAQRGAINTALSFTLSPIQQAHIGFSTLATLLYLPVFILGYRRLKGKATSPQSRSWHIRLGLIAFVARSIGFILMFSLLSHVRS